jgi:hypothetical protein|tara:strand:+ start:382 stop:549 length:168 start_codon:yes stop_codon:yes gene_type:complete
MIQMSKILELEKLRFEFPNNSQVTEELDKETFNLIDRYKDQDSLGLFEASLTRVI